MVLWPVPGNHADTHTVEPEGGIDNVEGLRLVTVIRSAPEGREGQACPLWTLAFCIVYVMHFICCEWRINNNGKKR